MLDDIIYWAEYYLVKKQDHSFRGGWLSDTLVVITLCLLFNLLTLFYCVEFYLGWDIIQHIPREDCWENHILELYGRNLGRLHSLLVLLQSLKRF